MPDEENGLPELKRDGGISTRRMDGTTEWLSYSELGRQLAALPSCEGD
jgi:hypothetical protein